MSEDRRRKLSEVDYSRIRFLLGEGYTIRQLAGEFGVTTKYVKKIQIGEVGHRIDDRDIRDCSGCGIGFNYSGLRAHFYSWTSGGIHDLWCSGISPSA